MLENVNQMTGIQNKRGYCFGMEGVYAMHGWREPDGQTRPWTDQTDAIRHQVGPWQIIASTVHKMRVVCFP
jgi:hypothetical protein